VHAADSSCPTGEAFRLGTYVGATLQAALPAGTWRLVLTRGTEDPRTAVGGVQVRLVSGQVTTLSGDDEGGD
jgi:hypothetical protein